MTDDIIEVKETVQDGKNYVIAYSLREQKRSNDLKEAFLFTLWVVIGLLIVLYAKLDAMNVVSKLVG